MIEDEQVVYQSIGTFPPSDAKALLDAFEERGIRFHIAADDEQLKNMNPVLADGGLFGQGSGLAIAVCAEDLEEAGRIQQHVFKIEV